MKRKIWVWILAGILLLAVLFTPIPTGVCRDGGTRTYTALTYKLVDWHRLTGAAVYDKTAIYLFPNNFKSVDALWELEKGKVGKKLLARVVAVTQTDVIVQAVDDDRQYRISPAELENICAEQGSVVEITYAGDALRADSAVISGVIDWEPLHDLRHQEYTGQWLDKETAEKHDNDLFGHIVITEIYANCFFC